MSDTFVKNRCFVVLGAVLIQLCLGAIYAWSIFTSPLTDAGWTKVQTQIVFAVGLAAFALIMLVAGRKLATWGPQKLAIIGGLMLGTGYVLAGVIAPYSFPVLVICLGILGGAGIGLAYVVPIAVGMRWFPDKKGMITGLAVAGFGFGAMGWVKLAGAWGHLIADIGLGGTFIVYGVVFAVLVLIGSMWMVFPPDGWKPEGWNPEKSKTGVALGGVDFTGSEMLRTYQFYAIFLTFTVSAAAGLMSIGLMKLYPSEALMASGLDQHSAEAIAGTAMAIFFSLANGVGRIVWGMISDKIGRRLSILIMATMQGFILLMFTNMAGSEMTLYLGATLIGFNFGGNFALFPSITADMFGSNQVGRNYPYVFMAYGLGGIGGPILGGILGDMHNFPLAFTICGVSCIVAAGLIATLRYPSRERLVLTKQKA